MALQNEPTLLEADEVTAHLLAVSDATQTGKPRLIPLRNLRRLQEDILPFRIVEQRQPLVSYMDSDRPSASSPNELNIKAGSTRWRFDEFQILEFICQVSSVSYRFKLSAETFAETHENSVIYISGSNQLWWHNASAFRVNVSTPTTRVENIYGLNFALQLGE